MQTNYVLKSELQQANMHENSLKGSIGKGLKNNNNGTHALYLK